MTISRLISSDTRAGILVAIGTTLLLAPFAIGLSAAAVAAGVGIGVVTVGLGLAGTAFTGRGTIPVSAHAAYDQGLAAGLLLSGLAFLLAGEPVAALLFAGIGFVQMVIGGITRYTVTPA
jgi:hypothetical protein